MPHERRFDITVMGHFYPLPKPRLPLHIPLTFAFRRDHAYPAMALSDHRADGVPAKDPVIQINGGNGNSVISRTRNDTGNAIRCKPFLHASR